MERVHKLQLSPENFFPIFGTMNLDSLLKLLLLSDNEYKVDLTTASGVEITKLELIGEIKLFFEFLNEEYKIKYSNAPARPTVITNIDLELFNEVFQMSVFPVDVVFRNDLLAIVQTKHFSPSFKRRLRETGEYVYEFSEEEKNLVRVAQLRQENRDYISVICKNELVDVIEL